MTAPAGGAPRKGVFRDTPEARIQAALTKATQFWAARGVQTGPIHVEYINDPGQPPARGGYGKVIVNRYWMAPNKWAADQTELNALVFHEVKHALPGGAQGGVDGMGHTDGGLMGRPISSIPDEARAGISRKTYRKYAEAASRQLQRRHRPRP